MSTKSEARAKEQAEAALAAERDRAVARLARVTDDSMAERVRDELAHATIGSGYDQTTIALDEAAEMADWVLAAIRAVAADEQEDDAHPGTVFG